MTILTTPGCFRSMLFYRVDSPECAECDLARECASALKTKTEEFLERVQRFDSAFGQSKALSVQRALKLRLKRDRTKHLKTATLDAMLQQLRDRGFNVYELKYGMNPAKKDDGLVGALFQLFIDLDFFTKRDLVEEVWGAKSDELGTKNAVKNAVSMICDALVHAGVLKSESRGILCLNR